jgi:hypothetical protein
MTMKKNWIAVLAIGISCAAALPASEAPRPEVRVKKAARPISVDGKLDEAAWKGAAEVTLRSADGKKDAARGTRVKIAYDDRNLYLAFACQDPDIWTAHRGRDSHMWTEDVIECFIDVDPEDPAYVELEVNPHGDIFDGLFFARRGKVLMSWNPEIRAAVAVDGTVDKREDVDRSWTVEMAIPVAELAPAAKLGEPGARIGPGISWGINFNRVENSGGASELQSWAAMRGDFHATELYGRIVFE